MTTPSEPSLVQLWLHGGLDLSEQLQKEPPECPAENVSAHPTPHRDRTLVEQGVHRSLRLYNVLAGLLCVVLSALMLLTAADLPPYGSDTAPTVNEVAQRYVEQGTQETGAVNTVAGHDPGLPCLRYPGRILCAVHRHVRRDHPAQPLRQKALASPARRGGLCLGPHRGPHEQVSHSGDPGVRHLYSSQRPPVPRRRLLRRCHSGQRG